MSDLHIQTKVTAQPKHFTSLRGFLAALDQMNDLHEVRREVDTDLEIGAIIRRTHETYAPAPLLTNRAGSFADPRPTGRRLHRNPRASGEDTDSLEPNR